MTRICTFLILSLVCITSCIEDSGSTPSTLPNVLLILTDDQGWGDLSIHGNTNLTTPNIDRIFKEGIEFSRFYVSPVCSPTRAEILTGRHHARVGVYATSAGGERLDADEETIADVFKAAGYQTGAFGKWHNGGQYPYHPNGRGFEEFYGFCSGHWGHYFSPMLEHNGEITKGEGFVIDDFTNRAIDFIEESVKVGKPFFTYLAYNTPHSPMQVPDQYWDRFKDKELEMTHHAGEEDRIHTKAALAMCENIDDNVGRLLSNMEKRGVLENTIVIYMSDNGPNGNRWNQCMKGRKGSTDEGGVRSPMAMMWKGKMNEGMVTDQIASGEDLLPTLTDLCEIEYQSKMKLDGLSLTSVIKRNQGSEALSNRKLFHHWRDRVSVRTQNYKLSHEDFLYDMTTDSCQLQDVSSQYPVMKSELLRAKARWKKEVLSELKPDQKRPFIIGHPAMTYTQLPARDASASGAITRSNKYPNDSFYKNWKDASDSIYWDVTVPESGIFNVNIYYTAPPESIGSSFSVSYGSEQIQASVTASHDPPLIGAEQDRSPRIESYVKDFISMPVGQLKLEAGEGVLYIKPVNIHGDVLMDFRLLVLERVF